MKKILSTILLGASLTFGANQSKAQECGCEQYNHDSDEFYEEIICYNTKEPTKKNDIKRYTIIYYSDKDGDDFYENIRVFNCDRIGLTVFFNIEDFNIEKSTGLIDYNYKVCSSYRKNYLKNYSNKLLRDIVKDNDYKNCRFLKNIYSGHNLTQEIIYSLYPEARTFYGGFGERVKKLINASKDQIDLKTMVSNERYLWDHTYNPK